jgi:hypothetical protein
MNECILMSNNILNSTSKQSKNTYRAICFVECLKLRFWILYKAIKSSHTEFLWHPHSIEITKYCSFLGTRVTLALGFRPAIFFRIIPFDGFYSGKLMNQHTCRWVISLNLLSVQHLLVISVLGLWQRQRVDPRL